jgi:hypothetical protein
MTPTDWAQLALAAIAIMGAGAALVRWLVIHYLAELKPNGGSSVKDQVSRLERRVDEIYTLLINNKPGSHS